MTKICGACSTGNRETARFCKACGARLATADRDVPEPATNRAAAPFVSPTTEVVPAHRSVVGAPSDQTDRVLPPAPQPSIPASTAVVEDRVKQKAQTPTSAAADYLPETALAGSLAGAEASSFPAAQADPQPLPIQVEPVPTSVGPLREVGAPVLEAGRESRPVSRGTPGSGRRSDTTRRLQVPAVIAAALAIGVAGGYLIFSPDRDTSTSASAPLSSVPAPATRPEAAKTALTTPSITASTSPTAPPDTMARDESNGCHVWKPSLQPNETVKWSGGCVDSMAADVGKAEWFADGKPLMTYEGTFRRGMLQGQGRMLAAGGDVYDGDYVDGQRDGRGSYVAANGERYDGDWKANRRHGTGTLIYANGDRYEGDFRDNKREGRGTYTKPDGERYVGEYRDDRREGQGLLVRADGARFEGMFKEGKPLGQVLLPPSPKQGTSTSNASAAPSPWAAKGSPAPVAKPGPAGSRPQAAARTPPPNAQVLAERPSTQPSAPREAVATTPAAPPPGDAKAVPGDACRGLASLRLEQCRECRDLDRLRRLLCEEKVRFTYCIGRGRGTAECAQPEEKREGA